MSARGIVWLVEDSPLEARAALQGLAAAHDVTVFSDGPSMIERLSAEVPEVIVLDWNLPVLSGIEICEYLRNADPPLDLGIILVTGMHRRVEDLVVAFEAGADDYVVKPYAEAELAARVGALVRAKRLRQRAALAEQALRRQVATRDAFLAMLAHELRNPLAPVLTALELWKMSPASNPDPRTRKIIERQVERLVRLVDDLLEISRVTRGRIELRRKATDVGQTIVRSIEDVQGLLDAQQHRVVVEIEDDGGPLVVDADPVRLEQVFSNLLHNAAKYTPAGGRIRVDAARVASDVVVLITDEGVGIAADMLHRVFELFVQDGSAVGPAPTGLGVGLTLARQLVEMHGGTIDATSGGVGKGARFSVRLPVSDEPVSISP